MFLSSRNCEKAYDVEGIPSMSHLETFFVHTNHSL